MKLLLLIATSILLMSCNDHRCVRDCFDDNAPWCRSVQPDDLVAACERACSIDAKESE